jgi:carboxylesterase type B
VPIRLLVDIQESLKISEFRATSDDAFVSKRLMANINNGDFAKRMKARGMKLMNGECRDEHNLYRTWRTPTQSYGAVRTRLIGDYPPEVVDKLMDYYCSNSKSLPSGFKDWQDLFGHIYADMQVHHLERGFYRALENGGLTFGKDVLRYRFDWRAKCVDSFFPPEWGVTHATDMGIWFWGLDYGSGLDDEDKEIVRPWNKALAAFVNGADPDWGTSSLKEMKRLRSDGKTDIWIDDRWEEGLKVWDLVNGDGSTGVVGWIRSKL